MAKTFFVRELTEGSQNGFFCSHFLSQRPVPGVPSPALSINAVGSFSPNKQVFLPKKIGSLIGCRDASWDLRLRCVLHLSGLAPSLFTLGFCWQGGLAATLISEGPWCCESCPWLSSPLESILHLCLFSFLNASSRSSFTSCFRLWGHMWFRHNAQM